MTDEPVFSWRPADRLAIDDNDVGSEVRHVLSCRSLPVRDRVSLAVELITDHVRQSGVLADAARADEEVDSVPS